MNLHQSNPHTLRRAIAVALSLLAIWLGCAFGAVRTNNPVRLAWTALPDAESYAVGYGEQENNPTNWVEVGNVTNYTLELPLRQTNRVFIYCCGLNPVGSGPRSNGQFVPGDRMVQVAAGGYWQNALLCSTNLKRWAFTNSPWIATNPAGAQFFQASGQYPLWLTNWVRHGNP